MNSDLTGSKLGACPPLHTHTLTGRLVKSAHSVNDPTERVPSISERSLLYFFLLRSSYFLWPSGWDICQKEMSAFQFSVGAASPTGLDPHLSCCCFFVLFFFALNFLLENILPHFYAASGIISVIRSAKRDDHNNTDTLKKQQHSVGFCLAGRTCQPSGCMHAS